MLTLPVGYRTGSGNVMKMTVHGFLVHRDDMPIMEEDLVEGMCNWGTGCKGHNGGCPPYAPYFDKMRVKSDKLYVIVVEFDMAGAITHSGWWKGVSAPGLYILVYADRLTMCYTQRLLKEFEKSRFYTLGLSNCPGCRLKDCTVLEGGRCNRPEKRRYSMEAVGVACHELQLMLFYNAMPWWYKTPEHMPCRMYRYAGVFASSSGLSEDSLDNMLKTFAMSDKSYVELADELPSYPMETFSIPDNCVDGGMPYGVYHIPVDKMQKKG